MTLFPVFSLGAAAALLLLIARRTGAIHPLTCLAAVYSYLAFGPLLGSVIGLDLYRGVIQWQVSAAALVFLSALSALAVVAMANPPVTEPATAMRGRAHIAGVVLAPLLAFGCVLSGLMLYSYAPSVVGLGKALRIAVVGVEFHYTYLSLQSLLICLFYETFAGSNRVKYLYCANAGLYVAYCVLMLERDFVFAGLAIAAHASALSFRRVRSRRLVVPLLTGAALVLLLLQVNTTRNDNGASWQRLLTEGSLLFVNTRVIDIVSDGGEYQYGKTYLETLLRLAPSFLVEREFNLVNWFKTDYAPESVSGYGFALDAEAYLNGGYPAVFVLFLALGSLQRLCFVRYISGSGMAATSVLFTSTAMYALRNDSLGLVKPVLYGACFYYGLWAASQVLQAVVTPRHDAARVLTRPVS